MKYEIYQQLYALRRLVQGDYNMPKGPLGNNVRALQPLHHRTVRTNIDFTNSMVISPRLHNPTRSYTAVTYYYVSSNCMIFQMSICVIIHQYYDNFIAEMNSINNFQQSSDKKSRNYVIIQYSLYTSVTYYYVGNCSIFQSQYVCLFINIMIILLRKWIQLIIFNKVPIKNFEIMQLLKIVLILLWLIITLATARCLKSKSAPLKIKYS